MLADASRSATSTVAGIESATKQRLERIEQLVIPPAWQDVWISPTALRPAAGNRGRRRRSSAIPLPPGFPGRPGAGEVRSARSLRRVAAGVPGTRRRAPRARTVRAGLGLRARRDARQPRVVPRRLRAVRPYRSNVRHHHAHEAACRGARQADQVPLPGQAPCPRPDDARRRRAGRGDAGVGRASKAGPGSSGSTATGRARTSPARC